MKETDPTRSSERGAKKNSPQRRLKVAQVVVPDVQPRLGTVKFFNTIKGFGFIAPEGGSKDVYVHMTAFDASGLRRLDEGQSVAFQAPEQGEVWAQIELGLEKELEASVEKVIVAAENAINKIDRSLNKIAEKRTAIRKLRATQSDEG